MITLKKIKIVRVPQSLKIFIVTVKPLDVIFISVDVFDFVH